MAARDPLVIDADRRTGVSADKGHARRRVEDVFHPTDPCCQRGDAHLLAGCQLSLPYSAAILHFCCVNKQSSSEKWYLSSPPLAYET